MSEKLISPGVLTKEIDASFLPSAVGAIGAAIIGPAVKGPVLVPTIINDTRELEKIFGSSFENTNGERFEYFTTITAKNYLKHKSPITIVRVAGDGSAIAANSSLTLDDINTLKEDDRVNANDKGAILSSIDQSIVGTTGLSDSELFANSSITIGSGLTNNASASIGNVTFTFQSSADSSTDSATSLVVQSGSNANTTATNFMLLLNRSSSLHGLPISASLDSPKVMITSSTAGEYLNGSPVKRWNGPVLDDLTIVTQSSNGFGVVQMRSGSHSDGKLTIPFKLHALSEGSILNNQNEQTASVSTFTGELVNGDKLLSGSSDNFRWEIQDVNNTKGTFTLLIRSGQDTERRKQVLEQWPDLSLDPTQTNYIARVIGNQVHSIAGSGNEKFVKMTGEYPNKSKYVRVEVFKQTSAYLDENGEVQFPEFSASLPAAGSGSQGGGFANGSDGNQQTPIKFYDDIEETNTQGLNPGVAANGKTSYEDAINILRNQDEYDINLLFIPGLTSDKHGALITKAVDMCEERQDTFLVFDNGLYGTGVTEATSQAESFNTNYAATYYPWVQINDDENKLRWIPPSAAVAEAYAFNDKVANPWFAPAGLTRGKLSSVQTERKLLESQRNTLYKSNVNPIAMFPGQGVVVFGQKTLQKKLSALDRVNVRRLLIRVKKFIASSSRFLLFEQNTPALRKSFLNIAQPFLERVKSQSGLNAFKVVMDETNNTADTIDRNQLIGQIFLQPTKSAEFILLDFTIQRTGASFEE
tara:strand:- start:83 stop:2353 length:2271 start_codon:yes stop_codon:yes gene_type:complete